MKKMPEYLEASLEYKASLTRVAHILGDLLEPLPFCVNNSYFIENELSELQSKPWISNKLST